MNQYIYFSSKGNFSQNDTENSDFSVNFSNPIVIPPYAEIRCVNCRVNPNNNSYAVKEGQNDRLAFAVGKFWIEQDDIYEDTHHNAFPLFSVKLDEGVYDLKDGDDPEFYLNAQIESKINEQITNMPNLRGGVSVEIDANKILTIKVSPMGGNGFYGIPDGVDLPTDLLEKFKRINKPTTSVPGSVYFEPDTERVELAPFAMNGSALADADMKPPNQLGAYDVTTDSLVGTFVVDDIIRIDGQNIYAKVLAVAANKPTKIELWSVSDLWKTNVNPCNVNIVKDGATGNTCRITQFTSSGPDWRGVNLYMADKVSSVLSPVINRCGYFMSPPINFNSLGDWATSNTDEYKLVSQFTIALKDYEKVGGDDITTVRAVYSCFFDSLVGMDCGAIKAGFGAGPFSGAVIPWSWTDAEGYPIGYFPPDAEGSGHDDDKTTLVEDEVALTPYLFRAQFEITDEVVVLRLFNKIRDPVKHQWGWENDIDTVTGKKPIEINLDSATTEYISIETYVAPHIERNSMVMQIVIKTRDSGGDWVIKQQVKDIYPNMYGVNQLTSKTALDSKNGKPANIRFSYCHNFPNGKDAIQTDKNFTQPGSLYWAGAYNPIDEANGFVDGAFRSADYITSQATNLPTNIPVLVFGDDSLSSTDKLIIAQENPQGTTVVPWGAMGDALLQDSGANAGTVLGLDEQGWQFVNANSNTTGIVFSGNVNANARDFPQHYLDLPDLAVNNHTGTVNGTGRPNKFICPLDLNSGAGQNNIHSSQNETLVYNDLGNAMEERITNLRIRICDIDGTPSINLQNYTLGCLEIRENPQMKQMKMQRALKREEEEALAYQSAVRPTQFNRVQ